MTQHSIKQMLIELFALKVIVCVGECAWACRYTCVYMHVLVCAGAHV